MCLPGKTGDYNSPIAVVITQGSLIPGAEGTLLTKYPQPSGSLQDCTSASLK